MSKSLAQTDHIVSSAYLVLVCKKGSNAIRKSAPGRAQTNPNFKIPKFRILKSEFRNTKAPLLQFFNQQHVIRNLKVGKKISLCWCHPRRANGSALLYQDKPLIRETTGTGVL